MPERSDKLVAGALFFGAFAALLLVGAWLMWPANFIGSPLADVTATMFVRAAVSLVLAVIGLEFLAALVIVTQTER
jgi:hypothetical protein